MLLSRVTFTFILSLATTFCLVGCGKSTEEGAKSGQGTSGGHEEHEHGHAEEGPHHGHLVELGEEEYHAELVHDDAAGKVSVYLLDKTAKLPVAADNDQITLSVVIGGAPKEFMAKATDANKRDQFDSGDKELVDALDHDKEVKGRLHVSIGGKAFIGMIQHEKHGEHDHKH